uniref:Uncharacterized protein n=1 Tax=Rhizophora mucronata TaxID=61149 RepID=A0A2P2NY08_RHIMU
MKISFKQV